MIYDYLTKNDVKFEREKRFDDCFYEKKLPFDFYLPEQNICIEFDGIQHFKVIDYFGGKEEFDRIKKRDGIKTQYCKDKNIKLVRIKYTNNIIDVLNEKIKW